MSLLLKTREWVGLGEALRIALDEGVFPHFDSRPPLGEEKVIARRDLFMAYAERSSPPLLRVAYDSGAFFELQKESESRVWNISLPGPCLNYTESGFVDINPDGYDYFINPIKRLSDPIMGSRIKDDDPVIVMLYADFDGRLNEKSRLANIYFARLMDDEFVSILTWGDLIRGRNYLENSLLLNVQVLLELLAKAKGEHLSGAVADRVDDSGNVSEENKQRDAPRQTGRGASGKPPELPRQMQPVPPEAEPKGEVQLYGLHEVMPSWLEALADDDVVACWRGENVRYDWVDNARLMIKEAIERQRKGKFDFDEVVSILAKSSGESERRLSLVLSKAFDDGHLRFYTESGTPICPEGNDMPLSYGEVTTPADIDRCLEKIGALYRWPKTETTSEANTQLIPLTGHGGYTTTALGLLGRHVERFWVNYDPEEPDTAPDKDATLAWVRVEAKKAGLSQNIADAIDLLTRHENAKAGNRVKRVTTRKNTGSH